MLFFLLVIVLITLSSCTKPECKTSADCAVKSCTLSKCESKKCVYTLETNCCDNQLKETVENGKLGSKCTCPQDYGKCDGKGKIKVGSRTEDAAYVHYLCNSNNECVFGIDKKDIAQQNFLDSIFAGFFKASSVIKYSKPFDISSDSFELKITLDDNAKDIILPIKLTKVKLQYGSQFARLEQLIAEQELNVELKAIGDESTIPIKLNLNYRPEELEELGSIRYSLDYTYTRQIPGKTVNGTTSYTNEIKREVFNAAAKPVFFVRSG